MSELRQNVGESGAWICSRDRSCPQKEPQQKLPDSVSDYLLELEQASRKLHGKHPMAELVAKPVRRTPREAMPGGKSATLSRRQVGWFGRLWSRLFGANLT